MSTDQPASGIVAAIQSNPAVLEFGSAGYNAARERLAEDLRGGRSSETALRMASDLLNIVQAGVDRSSGVDRRECRAGCAYCCHSRVEVTPLDALAIAAHIQSQPAERAAEIASRLKSALDAIRAMTRDEHRAAKTRCAFLGPDDQCTIYEVRPGECRAHNSFSVDRCREAYERPLGDEVMIPVDLPAKAWLVAVNDAALAVLQSARVTHGWYELHSAVLRALQTPNAAARWIKGDDVFRGCLTHEIEPRRAAPASSDSRAKTGRNDPCPCGSGKKFKNCCLRKL